MKFCPECGYKFFDSAKFCPECGINLAAHIVISDANKVTPTPKSSENISGKDKRALVNCKHKVTKTSLRNGFKFCVGCGFYLPSRDISQVNFCQHSTEKIADKRMWTKSNGFICSLCDKPVALGSSAAVVENDKISFYANQGFFRRNAAAIAICVFVAVIWVIGFGNLNPDEDNNSQNSTSQTATQDNSQDFGISTEDAIKVISEAVGSQLNQDDAFRSVTFPNLTDVSNFWSIPYLTVIIYPDETSLMSSQSDFEMYFSSTYGGNWEWMSCKNVMAVFDSKYEASIDTAMSTWCKG